MPDQELAAAPGGPPAGAPSDAVPDRTTREDGPDLDGPDPDAAVPDGAAVEGAVADAVAADGAEDVGDLAVERGLDDLELAVLELERRTYRHQGAKEQAVRDELDLSATRYYQVLNALLDDPAALAREPVLVSRARRLRDERLARGAQ